MMSKSTEKPVVALIAAVASNGVIGNNNDLPWHIPEDLQYFKDKTLNKPIIMGRRTFDSVGKPLPRRLNLVVSRDTGLAIDGATVVPTLQQALELARSECLRNGQEEIMVVGGQQLYELAIPLADRLYITEIELAPAGDTFFPAIDKNIWRETSCVFPKQASNINYFFKVYERNTET